MKKNILVVLFFLSALKAVPQQWYLSYSPRSRSINAINIFNPDTLLVAGGNLRNDSIQSAFRSTNSGLTWDLNLDVRSSWIKSVAFTDSLSGIAVCAGGRIIKTTDAGLNWSPLIAPINRDFNKIFFIDSLKAIVVGGLQTNQLQTILKTTDGGQSWNTVFDQSGFWLNSVYFLNADTGYAVGDSGTILKSTNGGDNWTPVSSPIPRSFNSIWFTGGNKGYIVGGDLAGDSMRTILNTSNGGNTWTISKDEPGGWLTDVYFIDPNNGYAVGDKATLLKTVNGGQSWVPQVVDMALADDYFNVVKFYDQNFGVIGGREGKVFIYTSVSAPPEAFTIGSDFIDSTNVTLKGVVNSHGNPALYSFFYSEDSLFSSFFATADPYEIRSNSIIPVQDHFSGLTPNTKYYYFIKVAFLGGTTYGDTLSFYTGTPFSEFKTLQATAITDSSAQLNAIINNFSFLPVNLFFQYGISPSFGTQIPASPSLVNDTLSHALTYNLHSLLPNTNYYYRLKGVTSTATYYGDTYSFYTGTLFMGIHTLPATVISDTVATLNGIVNGFTIPASLSFDYSIGNTAFNFNIMASPVTVNDASYHDVSATISPLTPGMIYFFRLKAITSLGTFYGDTILFSTDSINGILHTLPATNITSTSFQANGTIDQFSLPPVNLSFLYGTTASQLDNEIQGTPGIVNDSFAHQITASLTGLQNSTLYYYRLKAELPSGGRLYGETKSVYVGANPIPNWDFQYWNDNSVQLPDKWSVVTDDFERIQGHSGNYALRVYGMNLVILGLLSDKKSGNGGGPLFYGGMPFNYRPDSVAGYFNYSIASGDTALMLISLTNGTDRVAFQIFPITGNSGGVFKRLSYKIDYLSALTPDSLVMGFIPMNPFGQAPSASDNSVAIDDITFGSAAPLVDNAGFENWFDYHHEKLESWFYTKNGVYDYAVNSSNPPMVTRTYFNAPSDYAAEIRTMDVNGDGGNLIGGTIATSLNLFNENAPSFPVSVRHRILNGYYKYFPDNNDTMVIRVMIFSEGNIIGEGSLFQTDSVTEFQLFNVAITYTDSIAIPDSATIKISTCQNFARGNSLLVIDKLSFDGFTSDTVELDAPQQLSSIGIKVIPNPATSFITVQWANTIEGRLQIYDLKGRMMQSWDVMGTKAEVDVRDFPRGLYMIRILSGANPVSTRFMIIR